jgi:hypothetical protein
VRADPAEKAAILAWHFLREDGCLNHPPHTKVEVGQTLKHDGNLIFFGQGYHASVRAIDAIRNAPGPIVCRVELSGIVVEEEEQAVASERRVIAMANASTVLHEFACDTAEARLREHGVTDEKSWAAIETKRKWLKGEATDAELNAAAQAVVRGPAWDAVALAALWAARWALEVADVGPTAAQNIDLEERLQQLLALEEVDCE